MSSQAVFYAARDSLPWCDGKLLKAEFDAQILAVLGPMTEADSAAAKNALKKPKVPEVKATQAEEKVDEPVINIEDEYKGRVLPAARNSEETLAKVKAITGGKLLTRFPPEPNVFLFLFCTIYIRVTYISGMPSLCVSILDWLLVKVVIVFCDLTILIPTRNP